MTKTIEIRHFMNKFRKLGFIDYNGHLEVHSSLLNVVLHDQPQGSGVHAAPIDIAVPVEEVASAAAAGVVAAE
jgi:hypothetical protein